NDVESFISGEIRQDWRTSWAGSLPLISSKELTENQIDEFAILHQPRELVKLLYKFSENGSPLKYATHSWEMGQGNGMYLDLEDFLIKLDNAWKEISWKLREL